MNNAEAVKESIASKLLNMAKNVTEQSKDISDRVSDRLMPISLKEMPPDPSQLIGQEEWPKYFSEVREELFAIKNNLVAINNAIDRLEI
ncbi:MAG: hypothetical protein WC364_15235 [Eubacteriales bacterium]|jgi:hypothetical protein